jgi:hypothetical protein
MRGVAPAEYRVRIEKLWAGACADSTFATVKEGADGGYPTLTWLSKCPHNNATGKPELTWMKAVQGRDSFYLVQKAYKFEPTAEQKKRWDDYLDGATLCDTRRPERPCKYAAQSSAKRRPQPLSSPSRRGPIASELIGERQPTPSVSLTTRRMGPRFRGTTA